MKNVVFFVDLPFTNNEIFSNRYNRDRCLDPFIALKSHLSSLYVGINTQDIFNVDCADLIIVENYKLIDNRYLSKAVLLATECSHLLPVLGSLEYHQSHLRSYTYQDKWIDQKFFFPIRYCFNFPNSIPRYTYTNRKISCMIAGNKRCLHPGELYSERCKIVEWHEKNALADFDLYGSGWDRPHKMAVSWLKRKLLYRKPFNYFFINRLGCYRGKVESKFETMANYRFAYTLENANDIPGWVTEKIFDAMFAGCVPIYWGAPNISKYIPDNCYIHYEQFKSIADLHRYLKYMPESEYNQYLDAIEHFIQSPLIEPFTIKTFVNTLSKGICELLDVPFCEYHG